MKYSNLKGFIIVSAIVSIILSGFIFLRISSGIFLGEFDLFGSILVCCLISVIIGLGISKTNSMVRHYKLVWFVGVLGIVLGTVFIMFSIGGSLMFIDFFVSMLACFSIGGIIGIGIGKGESVEKHSRFFWFGIVLGFVFLGIFFANLADGALYYRILELVPFPSGISSRFLSWFVWFCLLGGTFFLTTGLCGVRSRHPSGRQFGFSVLVVILVPLFVFVLFYLILTSMTIGY